MHGGAYFVCCKIEGGIALWYQLGIFDGKVVVVVFFSVIFAQKVGDVGRGGGGGGRDKVLVPFYYGPERNQTQTTTTYHV